MSSPVKTNERRRKRGEPTPQAKWQQRQIARGRCPECGRHKRGASTRYCRRCTQRHLEWWTERAQARRRQGLCRYCGQESGGMSRCETCRERENARRRRATHRH